MQHLHSHHTRLAQCGQLLLLTRSKGSVKIDLSVRRRMVCGLSGLEGVWSGL